jgi:hypothetical protein
MAAKIPPKKPTKVAAAKPGKDIIYLDVDDEITSIIEKVEDTKQKIVALVLPKRAAMLQSIVNMRLLKRSATTAGKNVVLITSEHALLPLAGAAGIHVAKNLQSKPVIPAGPAGDLDEEESEADSDDLEELEDHPQKLDYAAPVGALAAASDEPEEIALDDEEEKKSDDEKETLPTAAAAGSAHKAAKGKNAKVPNFDRFRLLLLIGGGLLIAFIIFLILAVTVLPKATVTIKTSSTPVSLDTNYTASGTAKELDETKKIIPSLLKTSDQTSNQQVTATGQQNNGEKATGSVTLKNCSDSPATIPAGTGLSSSGQTFITQKTVSLDSGSFTSSGNCKSSGGHVGSVGVTAQSPGAKYNIGPSTFTISGFSNVGGTSSSAMSCGSDNNITVLTQQDIDGAKAKISSADSDKFSKDFQKQLSDQGLYVLSSTLKVGDAVVTSTPSVGQPASTAAVSIKITYSVITVQKTNLSQAVSDALNKQVDKNKEKLSDKDPLQNLTITVQNQQPNSPNATLSLSKDTTAIPIIDEGSVKAQLKGKKENQIKDYLSSYPGVQNVTVKFSPFWVSSAPNKTNKIKLVEQQVTSDSGSGQ